MTSSFVSAKNLQWIDLDISPQQMNPSHTLNIGQCFNWKPLGFFKSEITAEARKYWVGVVMQRPLLLRQLPHTTEVALLSPIQSTTLIPHASDREVSDAQSLKKLLRAYFQVEDHDLESLYHIWSENCPRMQTVARCLPGVRVVQQEPWECLISFICSSNNHISRISGMLDRLRISYGRYLCTVHLETNNHDHAENSFKLLENLHVKFDSEAALQQQAQMNHQAATPQQKKKLATKRKSTPVVKPEVGEFDHDDGVENDTLDSLAGEEIESPTTMHLFSFPTPQDLSTAATEQALRDLGFGYRAKFVVQSAVFIVQQDQHHGDWLNCLRNPSELELQGYADSLLAKARKPATSSTSNSSNNKKKTPIKSEHASGAGARDIKIPAEDMERNALVDPLHSLFAKGNDKWSHVRRQYVQSQLLQLPGVGRKVADCVALFSLDQSDCIPVDTHVWAIALRDYWHFLPGGNGNKEVLLNPSNATNAGTPLPMSPVRRDTMMPTTDAATSSAAGAILGNSVMASPAMPASTTGNLTLTPAIYDSIGEVFRAVFQWKAGWAHSVLFAAELPAFRRLLPTEMVLDMQNFAMQQKSDKAEKKKQQQQQKTEKKTPSGMELPLIKEESSMTLADEERLFTEKIQAMTAEISWSPPASSIVVKTEEQSTTKRQKRVSPDRGIDQNAQNASETAQMQSIQLDFFDPTTASQSSSSLPWRVTTNTPRRKLTKKRPTTDIEG